MAKYVYSTLTDDMDYAVYSEGTKEKTARVQSTVRIAGGANRVNKRTLITPRGMMTPITDAEAKLLEENEVFKIHKANGYITIDTKQTDADNAAKNLTKKDKAAQKTAKEYEDKIKATGEKLLKEVK